MLSKLPFLLPSLAGADHERPPCQAWAQACQGHTYHGGMKLSLAALSTECVATSMRWNSVCTGACAALAILAEGLEARIALS